MICPKHYLEVTIRALDVSNEQTSFIRDVQSVCRTLTSRICTSIKDVQSVTWLTVHDELSVTWLTVHEELSVTWLTVHDELSVTWQ